MPRFYHADGEPVDPADVLDEEELRDYYKRRNEDIRSGRIKFTGRVRSEPE